MLHDSSEDATQAIDVLEWINWELEKTEKDHEIIANIQCNPHDNKSFKPVPTQISNLQKLKNQDKSILSLDKEVISYVFNTE